MDLLDDYDVCLDNYLLKISVLSREGRLLEGEDLFYEFGNFLCDSVKSFGELRGLMERYSNFYFYHPYYLSLLQKEHDYARMYEALDEWQDTGKITVDKP